LRVVIASGGTGGHFYPGYALAKALRVQGHQVLFVLRTQDPAGELLAAEDLPFIELGLRGLSRTPSSDWFKTGFRLLSSLRVCFHALRAWRPAVVVGMGGYLTVPLAAAARLCQIPVVLHESNSVLGLGNFLCRPFASALALGLPLRGGLPTGAALTGTPIREELWASGQARPARERLGLDPGGTTLLVFGGSQGARAINTTVPQALAKTPLQVLHLAGAMDADSVRQAYAQSGTSAVVLPYLKEMHLAYAAADLVLCRSGASTLAELAAQAKPALLIPYPAATAGHQEINARVLEAVGAAEVMLQRDMTPESLAQRLSALADPERLAGMRQAYGRLELPSPKDSVEKLAGLVAEVARR